MRAPTEILGIRYFLLGVIFTRTNTRVESSHQGTPQNKNKSFSLSFPDCQSLWAGSAYITLGVASAFGPDHYILPHITQRIQAASAFQGGPHYISYPGAVPTLSRLHRAHLGHNTIHHHGDIPLPLPCCSMGFRPHIPGSRPCLRFHPPQSGVSSPPKVSSSPSVVHDHTFAAAWRVVGGCCFYEGKGPLVRSWGSVRVY